MNDKISRRDLVRKAGLVTGGAMIAVMLPASWTKPVIESIIAPANAAGFISHCEGTTSVFANGRIRIDNDPACGGTPASSTTIAPTTTGGSII